MDVVSQATAPTAPPDPPALSGTPSSASAESSACLELPRVLGGVSSLGDVREVL